MRWIEVTIKTTTEEIEPLCTLLSDLGVEGMVIEDESDFRNFLENNPIRISIVDEELEQKFSGISQIKFYLADDANGAATMARVKAAISAPITQTFLEDSDWENNWRKFYKPIPIGKQLLVVPEWEEADPQRPDHVATRPWFDLRHRFSRHDTYVSVCAGNTGKTWYPRTGPGLRQWYSWHWCTAARL